MSNFSHERTDELPEDGPIDGPKHVGVFFKSFICFLKLGVTNSCNFQGDYNL
jgi:hypothetical protein